MAIQPFDEERFPERIDFGFTGGPQFSTAIAVTAGGFEQRNINWEQGRRKWTAAHALKTQAEIDELLDFHECRRGSAVGFRFRDWMDYCSDMPGLQATGLIDPFQGTLDTLPAAGVLAPQRMIRDDGSDAWGVGDGVEVDFQLAKTRLPRGGNQGEFTGTATLTFAATTVTRSAGDWVADGFAIGQKVQVTGSASNNALASGLQVTGISATVLTLASGAMVAEGPTGGIMVTSSKSGTVPLVRTITKPVGTITGLSPTHSSDAQVIVYQDGVEATSGVDYTINPITGLVTFTVAPGIGVVVDADCLFDVPVRFSEDQFTAELEHFDTHNWTGVTLVELRV